MLVTIGFIICFGLIVGSFLGALTWRIPHEISIARGRSRCPYCKKTIRWYQNIPLFSFLFLEGKCAQCRHSISIRYPLIEVLTALLFVGIFLTRGLLGQNIVWLSVLPPLAQLALLFVVGSLLIALTIIDYEHQILPDEIIFVGVLASAVGLLSTQTVPYSFVLSGLLAAVFLLVLHMVTRGRGMGLGDVKYAILLGMIGGPVVTLVGMSLSFVVGAFVGLVLVVIGRASFGRHIPFGPFMTIGFSLAYLFGEQIVSLLWL